MKHGATAIPNDLVAYPRGAYIQTHPDRLATMAILHGMTPAPVEQCRVLEIGCGEGANLIAIAVTLPASEFLGIDLAPEAIRRARETASSLNLKNVTFQRMDLRDAGPALGTFDYGIAHGVYAWVAPAVQDRLLAISKATLNPNGIAFISYNAFPGAQVRLTLRHMMLFHMRGIQEPGERVARARALLQPVIAGHRDDEPWRMLLREEAKRLAERPAGALYYDELADFYEPVFFHQFVDRAQRHGLAYLSEADPLDMREGTFGPGESGILRELFGQDRIAREQYLDFIRLRKFRQTLLCHAGTPLACTAGPERLSKLYLSSPAVLSTPAPGTHPPGVEEYVDPNQGGKVATNNPAMLAALCHMTAIYPRADAFAELLDAIRERMGTPARDNAFESSVAEALWKLFLAGVVEVHAYCPPAMSQQAERPFASPLACWQAAGGADQVTSLTMANVRLDDKLTAWMLPRLDGTRDRQKLLHELEPLNPGMPLETLRAAVDHSLTQMARAGLLLRRD